EPGDLIDLHAAILAGRIGGEQDRGLLGARLVGDRVRGEVEDTEVGKILPLQESLSRADSCLIDAPRSAAAHDVAPFTAGTGEPVRSVTLAPGCLGERRWQSRIGQRQCGPCAVPRLSAPTRPEGGGGDDGYLIALREHRPL